MPIAKEYRVQSLSIIIPAYNEEENIQGTLENVSKALQTSQIKDFEVLVIDDGSKDRTAQIVTQCEAKYPGVRLVKNPKNIGFGASYRVGVMEAKKEFTVMVHGDNAWEADTLGEFFSQLGKAKVIIGYTKDMLKSRTLSRTIISKTFTFLMNMITQYYLKYYNGLQIHPSETLKTMKIVSSGYAFQPEVLIKSLRINKDYVEVGMYLTERMKGESKAFRLKNILEVLQSFFYLAKVRWSRGN